MSICLKPVDEGPPILVKDKVVLVGRHPCCDIVIAHSPKVSRRHCCFVQLHDRCVLRDLGSLNGTWVNGQRVVKEVVLKTGDKVAIADVLYVVREVDEKELKDSDEKALGASSQSVPELLPGVDLSLPSNLEDVAAGHHEKDSSSKQEESSLFVSKEDNTPESSSLFLPINFEPKDSSDDLPPLAD